MDGKPLLILSVWIRKAIVTVKVAILGKSKEIGRPREVNTISEIGAIAGSADAVLHARRLPASQHFA